MPEVSEGDIRRTAVRVVRAEAEAVAAQEKAIDAGFAAFAKHLLAMEGTLYVAGIGKSGLVARKIAGTLASVGVRAVNLSPTDALHGELGLLRPNDAVLALSNSGKTEELLVLAKGARARGARVAAMVGRVPSPLSELADWVLHAQVVGEATHVELPTSSALAMIALGDALAVVAIEATGFTESDFRKNHPGGSLGLLLGSRVEDVMRRTTAEVPVVRENDPLSTVVVEMTARPVGAALVLAPDGALRGIITDGDIRRALQGGLDGLLARRAADIMNPEPMVCRVGSSALDALRQMETGRRKVYVVPVLDRSDRAVGLVRMHDLVGAQLSFTDEAGE